MDRKMLDRILYPFPIPLTLSTLLIDGISRRLEMEDTLSKPETEN